MVSRKFGKFGDGVRNGDSLWSGMVSRSEVSEDGPKPSEIENIDELI